MKTKMTKRQRQEYQFRNMLTIDLVRMRNLGLITPESFQTALGSLWITIA
ncbi:hypothetical protein [Hymenobacter sedentarius]|nr:hypothetical protein [Hymenobacter sedentarius]